jgi:hypothetical protein
MPTTVADAFSAAGLRVAGTAPWGTPIGESGPGVYVVSLTADVDSTAGAAPAAPLDPARVQALLDVRPELRLDGMRPDATLLARRLAAFWPPDETILYIGVAGTSVRSRVGAYYRSPLGARRPHSGGWFLKTLAALDGLWVHHAPCPDPIAAGDRMLAAFSAGVTPAVTLGLHDPALPIPFANREWPRGRLKEHGITGARGPLPAGPGDADADGDRDGPGEAGSRPPHTQRLTAADLREGRIRLPKAAKALLPGEQGVVELQLRGHHLHGDWDPGLGAKRERSGVLRVPREVLDGLVTTGEFLVVRGTGAGVVLE